ncbi:hypothetical protein TI04_01485 [Achromatium sp. WMS2]|nr:hypothetical protein TI04_01485 [Achromatium sp. WMS2]
MAGPKVLLETTQGNITIELDAQAAPKTVANFLSYVDAGFYDGTVFHRVISGFMIQGGGMDSTLNPKATHAPITNEADNGLLNARGTIAMARTPDPHSASSQFFINLANNSFLNFRDKTPNGWGYAVFGRVIAGMETVDKIAALRTNMQDVPTTIPIIKHATRITTEDSK